MACNLLGTFWVADSALSSNRPGAWGEIKGGSKGWGVCWKKRLSAKFWQMIPGFNFINLSEYEIYFGTLTYLDPLSMHSLGPKSVPSRPVSNVVVAGTEKKLQISRAPRQKQIKKKQLFWFAANWCALWRPRKNAGAMIAKFILMKQKFFFEKCSCLDRGGQLAML